MYQAATALSVASKSHAGSTHVSVLPTETGTTTGLGQYVGFDCHSWQQLIERAAAALSWLRFSYAAYLYVTRLPSFQEVPR